MKTNDIKKGMTFILADGTEGVMADNKKGNTRMANVDNMFGGRNLGNVYAHNIQRVLVDGLFVTVEHTKSQLECRDANNKLFGG